MTVKRNRILIAASAIIGICCGFLLIAYLDGPHDFQLRRHIGLFAIMAAMSLFIGGHLWKREKSNG